MRNNLLSWLKNQRDSFSLKLDVTKEPFLRRNTIKATIVDYSEKFPFAKLLDNEQIALMVNSFASDSMFHIHDIVYDIVRSSTGRPADLLPKMKY